MGASLLIFFGVIFIFLFFFFFFIASKTHTKKKKITQNKLIKRKQKDKQIANLPAASLLYMAKSIYYLFSRNRYPFYIPMNILLYTSISEVPALLYT